MSEALPPLLATELRSLNAEQLAAVLHRGSVVVEAGPGSGKTRTLVARAGYILETQVSAFRGVACITYTTAAAAEIRQRLRLLGILRESRVVCATVHSFCLNEILRPYADLVGGWSPGPGQVLGDTGVANLLQGCFDQLGIADLTAEYRTGTLTHIRRALVCGESVDGFDQREVAAATLYEERLEELEVIDFEAMVSRALSMVRRSPAVRDLVAARFPHLIVDEYQDLGGALHQLVTTLHDDAGLVVAAVGDADQSIFGFTGADPKYLNELISRADFRPVVLEVNYRSGLQIISASEAALGRGLGRRRPRDGADAGEVRVVRIEGGLDEHAAAAVELVKGLAGNEPINRIAILYPRKGPLLSALLLSLESSGVPYLFERDESLPPGSLSKFVQRCASRLVASYQIRNRLVSEDFEHSGLSDLHSLEADYLRLREESGLPRPGGRLWVLRTLQDLLDPVEEIEPERLAEKWVARLVEVLELNLVADAHPDFVNKSGVRLLFELCDKRNLMVQDLAANVEVAGKVLLTTYHSSKGREFESVVMPGLVNGVVPPDVKVRGTWQAPTGPALAEQRRGFFVAVSRPEKRLFLLTGSGYNLPWGAWKASGPSVFLTEMLSRLSLSDGLVS